MEVELITPYTSSDAVGVGTKRRHQELPCGLSVRAAVVLALAVATTVVIAVAAVSTIKHDSDSSSASNAANKPVPPPDRPKPTPAPPPSTSSPTVLPTSSPTSRNRWTHGWDSTSSMTFADFGYSLLSQSQAAFVASKYRIISLEKCTGRSQGVTTETGIYRTARQVVAWPTTCYTSLDWYRSYTTRLSVEGTGSRSESALLP